MRSRRHRSTASRQAATPSRRPGSQGRSNQAARQELDGAAVEAEGPLNTPWLDGALATAFGADLGGLDAAFGRSAENDALGAQAHTEGRSMQFGAGLRPDTEDPAQLAIIAEEVAHALAGGGSGKTELDHPGDPGEVQAEAAGARFAAWAATGFSGAAPALQAARGGQARIHRHAEHRTFTGRPALRRGDRGGQVAALQSLLNHFGYRVAVDGDFGPATHRAVRSFQASRGLSRDGIAGPATAAALRVHTAGGASGGGTGASLSAGSTLTIGARGDRVEALQQLLNTHGYGLVVDGHFGRATLNAVYRFQRARGLSVDGKVGPRTAAALNQSPSTATPSTGGSADSADTGTAELTGRPMLRQGNAGRQVRRLQELLNTYGAGLSADGEFGAVTARAVRAFQASNNLEVDGQVGPATARSLNSGSANQINFNAAGPAGSVEGADMAAIREEVMTKARKLLGKPYWWGADGPTYFDCSGFVLYVLRQETGLVGWGDDTAHGIRNRVPRTSTPQKGDLVFFSSGSRVTHIEFATGNGSETLGASGGGSRTRGDDPNARVKYGNWNRDRRGKSFGSIAGLIQANLNRR